MSTEPTIKAFGLVTRYWTFVENRQEYGCSECCNRDYHDDEPCDHPYYRKSCPHCKGKGWIKIEDTEQQSLT